MAKQLLQSGYTVDAANDTIIVPTFVKAEELLLITDVTTNTILYNFADAAKGFASVTFDTALEQTTIVLDTDMSALSPATTDSSKLQIFVDRVNQKMDVADSLLDPVHKIRVSTPENLIDTDFEYGLQPTKWETLERSNNVPSFYVADGDVSLDIVTSVAAASGSNVITVSCTDPHGLVVGSPIDAQGLTSRTAEGKYLIKSVPTDESFTYEASAAQTFTGSIGTVYTSITPGQFYSGSQINYNQDTGISTDEANPSTLTITTPANHGFVENSSFYLTNTVGVKKLTVATTTATAGDGRDFVDSDQTTTLSPSVDLSKTETKKYIPVYSLKFDSTAVNTSNNTITWTGHDLETNDCLLYVPPSGDTAIGGLSRFDIYFVKKVDADTIQLSTAQNGSAINLTSAGTYNYGRGLLGVVYEIRRGYHGGYRQSYAYAYTWAQQTGNSYSGRDLRNHIHNGQYGLGGASANSNYFKFIALSRNGTRLSHRNSFVNYNNYGFLYWQQEYSTSNNAAMSVGESTTTPGVYNFVEDESVFTGTYYSNNTTYVYVYNGPSGGYFRFYNYYGGYYNSYYNSRDVFICLLKEDEEADSFHAASHGLESGNTISFTKSAGDDIAIQTGTTTRSTIGAGSYTVESVSDDRFRLQPSGGGSPYRIVQATGTYSWSAQGANPTANSFYLSGHNLASGDVLSVSAGTGGTLPTAQTGGKTSVAGASSDGTTVEQFNIFSQAFEDNITNYTSGLTDFNTYSQSNSNFVVLNSSGTYESGLYYLYNGRRSPYLYGDNQGYVQVTTNTIYPFGQIQAKEGGYAPFTATQGNNTTHVASDVNTNSTLSFHMNMTHIHVPSTVNNYVYHDGFTMLSYHPYYNQYANLLSNNGLADNNGLQYTTAAGINWQGRIASKRIRDTRVTYDWYFISFICYRDTTVTSQLSWSAYGPSSFYAQGNTAWPKTAGTDNIYKIEVWFQTTKATTLSAANIRDLVQDLLEDHDANFAYPAFTAGTYYANVVNTNRITLKSGSSTGPEVLLSGQGTGPLNFETEAQVGAIDGVYLANNATSGSSIALDAGFEVVPRTIAFDAASVANNQVVFGAAGHNLITGTGITYDNGGNTDISGLTDGTKYYAIVIDDVYIEVADSFANAIGRSALSLTAGTGSHTFKSDSLAGMAEAAGTVTTTAGSSSIAGTDTLFKRTYKPGDTIFIKNGSGPGALDEYTVISISSDTAMQLASATPTALSSVKHFSKSAVYARTDGYSIHRPFDGGVEIAAGTAPFSQITRQTRKYFRYQSGKGIQTSLAINFNPPITASRLTSSGTTATLKTLYPHRLSTGASVTVKNASDNAFNGDFNITKVDDFTFTYTMSTTPSTTIPSGIIKYNVGSYTDAATRAGMFDDQNGFFFEYEGGVLSCVRRSSVTQLSGTITVTQDSSTVTGLDTNFSGQLATGDFVVIRGMTYRVVSITNRTEMHVQPEYRGVSSENIILTKVEDIKVAQADWNLDPCDGTGPEGFVLDHNAIQMAYMDYSWYGAGKIRFGFKDREGHVRYVHEFIHNNRLDEAYMRSGNLPARYEVINGESPSYAPTLFHWGTSVIMDGTFDDDKAYLFTAASNSLSFTNGQSLTANTTAASTLTSRRVTFYQRDWFVKIPFATSDAGKFTAGQALYTSDGSLNGEVIDYTDYSGGNFNVYIYIQTSYYSPSSYPTASSGETVYIGVPATGAGDDDVNLGTDIIPLVSLRLAPSVDSNISGNLGERDILNRMQLKLNEVGLVLTHDCEVKLILNGDSSVINWESVGLPSLSQLQRHASGETIEGGVEIFSFRAAGGSVDSNGKRLSATSDFPLGDLVDMGNSILGGNGVFPNGPDVLTVAVAVTNTADISADSPFSASARITWSESQA